MKGYPSIIHRGEERQDDSGFTLVEILIAIVLVGILSAVVVVGISSLTDKGSKSACTASLDAAKAGTIVYYASNNNTYPLTLKAMTDPNVGPPASPAALTLPSGVTVNAADVVAPAAHPALANMQATSGSWWLDMTAGAAGAAPTFVCTP